MDLYKKILFSGLPNKSLPKRQILYLLDSQPIYTEITVSFLNYRNQLTGMSDFHAAKT
jgi:hypothetical protein